MPIFTLGGDELLSLQPVPFQIARTYKGPRIPGSEFTRLVRDGIDMYVQEYSHEFFSLVCFDFRFQKKQVLDTSYETRGSRIEWVISGEWSLDSSSTVIKAGQYHVTSSPVSRTIFSAGSSCVLVSLSYSPALINRLPIHPGTRLDMSVPRTLTPTMQARIFAVLQNTFIDDLLDFCYDNFLRDMLLLHLGTEPASETGTLTEREKASIYELDSLIASDISRHWTMPLLARKAALNEYTLKKGFSQLFGMAPFERLLYYRMQVACPLLEQTNKPLKEIADLAGYRSEAGFVTGFKRWFSISPGEWRRRSREGLELPGHRFD